MAEVNAALSNPRADIAALDALERTLFSLRYAIDEIGSLGPVIDPPKATAERGEALAELERARVEALCDPDAGDVLARLAAEPELLLMDEPFGAVDEITRIQLQEEIRKIHRESGITVLFVTHDIAEALKLSSRVLVLDQGTVQQCDAPEELLRHPATEFVARLVEQQRRTCFLPEERLTDCKFSGAASPPILT